MSREILSRIERLEDKLDTIITTIQATPDQQKYLNAKEVGRMVGLDARTILNRSNLEPDAPRYIPSLSFGSKRKYFDRRVIERLFRVNR
ncbi:MAG: hypothetical protein AAGG50_00505 [Bacteroidota bacterium]